MTSERKPSATGERIALVMLAFVLIVAAIAPSYYVAVHMTSERCLALYPMFLMERPQSGGFAMGPDFACVGLAMRTLLLSVVAAVLAFVALLIARAYSRGSRGP